MKINQEVIFKEIEFQTSRSSGKGGQHVNKTESRVSLFFNIEGSEAFSAQEKELLLIKFANRLNKESTIQIDVEKSRSQIKNKEIARKQLLNLLEEGLIVKKERKATKPNKKAIQKRIKDKKRQSEKKQNRKFKLD